MRTTPPNPPAPSSRPAQTSPSLGPIPRLVVAGHVDHGKSTVISALLSHCGQPGRVSPVDALREERDREMTIETTQVDIGRDGRQLLLVDVPGHLELLANMLTGASRATDAILVVAADEGVREQTCRHARLLAFLGLRRALVVVNKMDLLGYAQPAFETVAASTRRLLAACSIECLDCLPLAALAGAGVSSPSPAMPWCCGPSLIEALAAFAAPPAPPAGLGPCALVQSAAEPAAGLTFCTVRVLTGQIAAGMCLRLWPDGGPATVAEIRRFPADPTAAAAGETVGLACVRQLAAPALRRGAVLADAGVVLHATTGLEAQLFCFAEPAACAAPLVCRCGTQAVPVAGLAMAEGPLRPHDFHAVRLTLVHPLVVDPAGDLPELSRFTLERNGRAVAAGHFRAVAPWQEPPPEPSADCGQAPPSQSI